MASFARLRKWKVHDSECTGNPGTNGRGKERAPEKMPKYPKKLGSPASAGSVVRSSREPVTGQKRVSIPGRLEGTTPCS